MWGNPEGLIFKNYYFLDFSLFAFFMRRPLQRLAEEIAARLVGCSLSMMDCCCLVSRSSGWNGHAKRQSRAGGKPRQERNPMSALPPKADIDQQGRDVRFVPKADIVQCGDDVAIRS